MLAEFNQTYHAVSSSFIQHYLRATQKSFTFRLHLGVPRFCYNISFPEKLPQEFHPGYILKCMHSIGESGENVPASSNQQS